MDKRIEITLSIEMAWWVVHLLKTHQRMRTEEPEFYLELADEVEQQVLRQTHEE